MIRRVGEGLSPRAILHERSTTLGALSIPYMNMVLEVLPTLRGLSPFYFALWRIKSSERFKYVMLIRMN